jgi:glycosyltransferase involved in cell wall biosynthesis
MPRPPLTAIIHTFDEADQIADCLRTVEWADEIYLLDSFSTDGTPELVRAQFPRVRIEQRESLGSAAQKNYGISRAAHDWIFIVDADERVPDALRDEILATLETEPRFHAYSIGRRNFVLGEEVRYSQLQRDRVTRLFHREFARYPNRRVHADLEVNGQTGRLLEKYVHYYIRSLDHQVAKMTRYGEWGAAQRFLEGKRLLSGWTVFAHTAARLCRDLIFNLGFLDGAPGLVTVGLHTWYTFWKYAKLWEHSMRERSGLPVQLPAMETDEEIWAKPWEEVE